MLPRLSFLLPVLAGMRLVAIPTSVSAHPMSALAGCDAPTWTISDMKVTYGAEVSAGGKASWTFSSSLSDGSDAVSCSLRANSRCEVVGTPNDKGVHIYLQISIDTIYWTINQTLSCGSSSYVLGVAEMPLDCPKEYSDDMTCTLKSGTIQVSDLARRL